MNKLTFRFRECGKTGVCCESTDGNFRFRLNTDSLFENREILFLDGGLLFDGYSIWFESEASFFQPQENFSLSLCFIPISISSGGDGLFSFYDGQEEKGIALVLNKDDSVQVVLGDGSASVSFSSINAHIVRDGYNVITVVYHGDAGWCDLYVNGILSNRRQFRRHTRLSWPKGKSYLGKRVDHAAWPEQAKSGCFHGFMYWAGYEDHAMERQDIEELHRRYYSGEALAQAAVSGAPHRTAYDKDHNRPGYHLIAPGKWMNEPHGPMFYGGWYHIFYQANPHAPLWDHIQWGHVVSRDMLHWKDCPIALCPEPNGLDADGCWSGSGMIDKKGIPRIYYTAGNDKQFPNQGVAMAVPESCEGGRLEKWRKKQELVQRQDVGWLGEFRDPFVWLENDTYFMLVGTGDENNGGGNAALYSSPDGVSWESHGFLVDYDYHDNREVGHVWELPVLLPLHDENGKPACHILLLCACQTEGEAVETYYFLGKWDFEKKSFTKFHDRAMLLDLGHGIFTGPSGFVTPDLRSVLFTIAQGKRNPEDEFHAGWAHNGGLPLELSLRKGMLYYQPIRELKEIRREKLLELIRVSPEEANEKLAPYQGDSLCLEVTASGAYASLRLCYENGCREVYYDRGRKRLGARNESGDEIGIWRGTVDDVEIGDEAVHFICYLDHSMLETYLNGVKSVTLRNYTEGSRMFQISEQTGQLDSLVLWEMESVY